MAIFSQLFSNIFVFPEKKFKANDACFLSNFFRIQVCESSEVMCIEMMKSMNLSLLLQALINQQTETTNKLRQCWPVVLQARWHQGYFNSQFSPGGINYKTKSQAHSLVPVILLTSCRHQPRMSQRKQTWKSRMTVEGTLPQPCKNSRLRESLG